jgi:hypothetical protein
MKAIVSCVRELCVVGMAFLVFFFAGCTGAQQTGVPPQTTALSYGDAGTDHVVAFYKALLQKEPPTLEQEQSLFNPTPGLRSRMVLAGKGKANDPVILAFFREHKDLFFPKKLRSVDSVDNVVVSSTFHWIQNLKRKKEEPKGAGYVLALFLDDPTAGPGFHTIVFSVMDGKIEAGEIWLDGYGNKSSLEEFLKVNIPEQPPALSRADVQASLAKWEGLVKTELASGSDRKKAEAWFAKHGIKPEYRTDTAGDGVGGKSVSSLAGLRDSDLSGMLRCQIGCRELHWADEIGGWITIYLFFDKQGRFVGHYVGVEAW